MECSPGVGSYPFHRGVKLLLAEEDRIFKSVIEQEKLDNQRFSYIVEEMREWTMAAIKAGIKGEGGLKKSMRYSTEPLWIKGAISVRSYKKVDYLPREVTHK